MKASSWCLSPEREEVRAMQEAHEGQYRRVRSGFHVQPSREEEKVPYATHPWEVAQWVEAWRAVMKDHPLEGWNAEDATAREWDLLALYHDVEEDCGEWWAQWKEDHREESARRWVQWVHGISNPPRELGESRRQHKKRIHERLGQQGVTVQTVKCFDVWVNGQTVREQGIEYTERFVREKTELLQACQKVPYVLREELLRWLKALHDGMQCEKAGMGSTMSDAERSRHPLWDQKWKEVCSRLEGGTWMKTCYQYKSSLELKEWTLSEKSLDRLVEKEIGNAGLKR